MRQHSLIFLGPSGSGKGTQIKLVKEYLREKTPDIDVAYMYTGDMLREMWSHEKYTNILSKNINLEGGLQPGFIPVMLWSKFFIENLLGNEHIIFDGTPRRINDAELLESAFVFYNRVKPTLVFVDCPLDVVKQRIIERATRPEDRKESTVDSRLQWYVDYVIPTIDFYRNKDMYNFVEINGNQEREKVFAEIKQKVFNDYD